MIKLLTDERRAVADYIYSISGISLDESKGYLIEGRLGSVLQEAGCSSFTQFLARARTDSSGVLNIRIIDAITTNETLFFRDQAPFNLLRHKLIPDLIDRRARANSKLPIRIWSAACSTGQELYSIAILLKELLGDPSRYNFRLLGTDISDQAVARASRGVFSSVEISRGLDEALRTKYFRMVGDSWHLRDEIRGLTTFKTVNLMKDFSALGKFDVILCRNVAIYFADSDRVQLFGRMERALEQGGSLIIGAMESLERVCPQFETKRYLQCPFYQTKTSISGNLS
jgi:chemotaxis protein methyltransferase CheR